MTKGMDAIALNDINIVELSNEIKLQVIEPVSEFIPELPIIDGFARSEALRIANKIQDEAHKWWGSKKVILNEITRLNKYSTYVFLGFMITTSRSRSILGDIKRKLTYQGLKYIVSNTLKLAEDAQLSETFQYKKLKKEFFLISNECNRSPRKTVNKKILQECNMFLENLFMEMSKILH